MGLTGIGDILVAVACVLWVLSGFAYLFGDSRLTKRLVVGGIILAASAPLFEASLVHLAKTAEAYSDVLLIAFVVAVVLLAFSRYGRREPREKKRKPTSLKKRVDD